MTATKAPTPLQALRAAHKEELATIKQRHKEEKDALVAKIAAEKARIKAEKTRILEEKKRFRQEARDAAAQRKVAAADKRAAKRAAKEAKPVGTVTIGSEVFPLTKQGKEYIACYIGAKKTGMWDVNRKMAQGLLDVVAPNDEIDLADGFVVHIDGRKTALHFTVDGDDLRWEAKKVPATTKKAA